MKLSEFLRRSGRSLGDFALEIGVSYEAVRRYARGERIPAPPIMRRIYEATGGFVTPADFLDLPPPHGRSLPPPGEAAVKEVR